MQQYNNLLEGKKNVFLNQAKAAKRGQPAFQMDEGGQNGTDPPSWRSYRTTGIDKRTGRKIGSPDNGNTWFDMETGMRVQ